MVLRLMAALTALVGGLTQTPAGKAVPQTESENPPWKCEADSDPKLLLGAIKAVVRVDPHGKFDGGEVTWDTVFGTAQAPSASASASWWFNKDAPTKLYGRLIFLSPNLTSQRDHDALWKRKFRLRLSIDPDPTADWQWGYMDLVRRPVRWNEQSGSPSFNAKADEILAMARGSDQLFLVAQNEKGRTLLSQDLHSQRWGAMYEQAQKLALQATNMAATYKTSCMTSEAENADIAL